MEWKIFSFDVFHLGAVVTQPSSNSSTDQRLREMRGMVMKGYKNLIDLVTKSNFFKCVFGATTYRRHEAKKVKIRVE